jgi:hypothetical protein
MHCSEGEGDDQGSLDRGGSSIVGSSLCYGMDYSLVHARITYTLSIEKRERPEGTNEASVGTVGISLSWFYCVTRLFLMHVSCPAALIFQPMPREVESIRYCSVVF